MPKVQVDVPSKELDAAVKKELSSLKSQGARLRKKNDELQRKIQEDSAMVSAAFDIADNVRDVISTYLKVFDREDNSGQEF